MRLLFVFQVRFLTCQLTDSFLDGPSTPEGISGSYENFCLSTSKALPEDILKDTGCSFLVSARTSDLQVELKTDQKCFCV